MPSVEFRIDPVILGKLFKLDVEDATLQNTLSGRPYLKLRCKARKGDSAGDKLYGTVVENDNGSVYLGVKKM